MGIYEKYFLPKLLNLAMKAPAMKALRKRLVPVSYTHLTLPTIYSV